MIAPRFSNMLLEARHREVEARRLFKASLNYLTRCFIDGLRVKVNGKRILVCIGSGLAESPTPKTDKVLENYVTLLNIFLKIA